MRQNGWKCTVPVRNESERNKGTPGERMSVCGWVSGWVGVLVGGGKEQRCMNGVTERKLERGKWRSDGAWGVSMWWVMPRSDPISVCWLTGGVQREVKPPPLSHTHTHTHTQSAECGLDRKQTDRQTRISHQVFVSSLTTTGSQPPPIRACILNPSLNSITHTLSILHIRHLLLHQQVVGLEKGRSHRGAGSREGYWFTHWLDPFFLAPLLSFCFPHSFKGLVDFDVDTGRNEKKKTRNAVCADEIKKRQRACKIIWP